jgi:hypothetical protein
METEKIWRVEWVRKTVYKCKSFRDEFAAKRLFQKHGNAKLTETEYYKDGTSKVLSVAVACKDAGIFD